MPVAKDGFIFLIGNERIEIILPNAHIPCINKSGEVHKISKDLVFPDYPKCGCYWKELFMFRKQNIKAEQRDDDASSLLHTCMIKPIFSAQEENCQIKLTQAKG